jgi:hypothetical protein
MQINNTIKVLAGALLSALLGFVQATADPITGQSSGNSDQPVQAPSVTPTTEPGNEAAEGGKNRDDSEGGETAGIKPFVPSETISADSAIAFPVDI